MINRTGNQTGDQTNETKENCALDMLEVDAISLALDAGTLVGRCLWQHILGQVTGTS